MRKTKMWAKVHQSLCLVVFSLYHHVKAQLAPAAGVPCSVSLTNSPCQAYALYRAVSPDYLDLAAVGDLFAVSRLMISENSNLNRTSSLIPGQSLFVPLSCSCRSINSSLAISFAKIPYTIRAQDNYYFVSTTHFQNLTSYQSVILVNPALIPTNLSIGVTVFFPIFCKCPNKAQLSNGVNYLVSYVFQPSDDLSSVALRFGVDRESITDFNGNRSFRVFETIFIPVQKLPVLDQPQVSLQSSQRRACRDSLVIGLAITLGIISILMALVAGIWGYRERKLYKMLRRRRNGEIFSSESMADGTRAKRLPANLLANIADCLDKYKVYKVEELKEATNDFSSRCLIHGSVYFGAINGDFFAIKKMKWNGSEELKILQKVNHGNLVRLEGFCIDTKSSDCYLVYEYIENGSLHSWIHGDNQEKLNWRIRLQIAVDVANGILYIHEHTRPRVVHKDIKSSNILLDSKMRAKIASFGLSNSGCNAITVHKVGTRGYCAPEFLAGGMVSPKMDVYSFGVVLLELVSGKEAVDKEGRLLATEMEEIFDGDDEMKLEKARAFIDATLMEDELPSDSIMKVLVLACACLQRDPSMRPSMVDIVYALTKTDDDLFFDVSLTKGAMLR